jgi:IPT/TIG domain
MLGQPRPRWGRLKPDMRTRRGPRRKITAMEGLERRLLLTLLGQQLFPSDYPWNQSILNAPVASNSAAIISNIGTSTRVHPDWGADSASNGDSPLYGIPFNVVHGNSTATVNVIIDNYPGESDIVPVPIPANAVVEGDYQDGPNPNGGGYLPGQRGDSHLIVWDEDNNIAYELFGVTRPSDPTLFPNTDGVELPHTDDEWHAAQETVWYMNTDQFRTLGETSADAAGLSILAGLVRPDEGLPALQGGQGAIDHALRVTMPSSVVNPQYIYPASHMVTTDGESSDNLPLGGRLRLENTPAIDALVAAMPPESQIIALAMQTYGLIVADIGSPMFVTGASASVDANNNISLTWNVNDIFASNGLEKLNAGDFQVVNLTPIVTGVSASASAGSTITVTGQNFSGAAGHLSVFFGSATSALVNVLSDTQLSVLVPAGSGTVNITVQSGVDETDEISDPDANVTAPIFGYGVSAVTSADQFTFAPTGSDTWTGAADGVNWGTPGNWSTEAVPNSSQNVIIPSGGESHIGSGTFAVASLTLEGTATVDMDNGKLLIDYGAGVDPIETIASEIASGYAGGAWNGSGIVSSSVATENASQTELVYGVGYADGADGIVGGLSSGQIEIMPTLDGDTNLAGAVAFGDLQTLAKYFNHAGGWDEGDFNYMGQVSFGDFQLLSQNFGQSESLPAMVGASVVTAPPATGAANPPETNPAGIVSIGQSAVIPSIFSDELLNLQ